MIQALNFETLEGAALKRRLDARLEELRRRNEDPALDIAQTQAIRGAIAEIKLLLTPPAQHVPSTSYGAQRREGR